MKYLEFWLDQQQQLVILAPVNFFKILIVTVIGFAVTACAATKSAGGKCATCKNEGSCCAAH